MSENETNDAFQAELDRLKSTDEFESPPEVDTSVAQQIVDIYTEQLNDSQCEVPVLFITGNAGTGKTYLFRQLLPIIAPGFALLASTTGIAAVNLGTTTIHSMLKYFDTANLEDAYARGRLTTVLHAIAQEFRAIVIDEISMLPGEQFKLIYQAVKEVNNFKGMAQRGRKLGIIVTGDFCQLPPVKAKWVFEMECWSHFADKTLRLTKNWRQGNEKFLEALNLIREGRGPEGAEALSSLVHWTPNLTKNFDGTTIVAKNDEVDRHNWLVLQSLPGPTMTIRNMRAGLPLGEWKKIPEDLEIKDGAYVMILANSQMDGIDRDEFGQSNYFNFKRVMSYANGDCGHIVGVNKENRYVEVELKRTGETVGIGHIRRNHESNEEPQEKHFEYTGEEGADPHFANVAHWKYKLDEFVASWDVERKKYIHGKLTWLPLRLAYAATVHKTQGLTLDKVQIDSRAHFFGSAGMAYVALSRARDPKNVYIVGSPKLFASKVKIDEKVRPWL